MGYKLKRIMMRPNGVEKQVRPDNKWKPGANTLLYLPLESDIIDQSGQATTRVFNSSGISYTTVGGVPSVHIGTTGGLYMTTPRPLITSSTNKEQTISILYYVTSQQTSSRRILVEFAHNNSEYFAVVLKENTTNIQYSDSYAWYGSGTTIVVNQWNNVVVTGNTSTRNIYINGSLAWSGNAGSYTPPRGKRPSSYENAQGILCSRNGDYSKALNGNARELIIEDKMWSSAEVKLYYDTIKSKLGF